MTFGTRLRLVFALVVTAALHAVATAPGWAADKVRLVISTRGGWELFGPEHAQAEGFFAAENLDVSIIYAQGGAETIQSLATGSQDVTVGVGTESVITAFAKGAPMVILANGRRGTGEVYWYVPKDSPIKSIKDLDGKVLVYSRPGSTTHTISKALLRDTGVKAELVSVGGMAAARTQVMSGQVATGWAAAPAGLDLVRKGEVRIIARGNEAKELADWSIRSTAANSNWVANNRDAAKRFMRALWKGIRFQYEGGDRALERFAKENKYDIEDVRRGHEFTPLKDVTYTPLNLAPVMRFAVEEKMIPAILTDEQVRKLVDIVYDPAKDG